MPPMGRLFYHGVLGIDLVLDSNVTGEVPKGGTQRLETAYIVRVYTQNSLRDIFGRQGIFLLFPPKILPPNSSSSIDRVS